jgi:hypothetical protein
MELDRSLLEIRQNLATLFPATRNFLRHLTVVSGTVSLLGVLRVRSLKVAIYCPHLLPLGFKEFHPQAKLFDQANCSTTTTCQTTPSVASARP